MEPDADGAFVHLITDHQPVIRAFIISLLPGAPGVDDVIQETNSVLWRKRGDFEAGTNFRAWSLTVARFQVMTHLRLLKHRRWVTLDQDVADLVADDIEEESDFGFEESRVEALRGCLEKLRRTDRDLLMQRYWHKTRLQDFAVAAGRSSGSLKVQLFRLRTILKRCIEGQLQALPGEE